MIIVVEYKGPVEVEVELDIGVDGAEPDVGIMNDCWYLNDFDITDVYINGKPAKNISQRSIKKLEKWFGSCVDLDAYDGEIWDYIEGWKDDYDDSREDDWEYFV